MKLKAKNKISVSYQPTQLLFQDVELDKSKEFSGHIWQSKMIIHTNGNNSLMTSVKLLIFVQACDSSDNNNKGKVAGTFLG